MRTQLLQPYENPSFLFKCHLTISSTQVFKHFSYTFYQYLFLQIFIVSLKINIKFCFRHQLSYNLPPKCSNSTHNQRGHTSTVSPRVSFRGTLRTRLRSRTELYCLMGINEVTLSPSAAVGLSSLSLSPLYNGN